MKIYTDDLVNPKWNLIKFGDNWELASADDNGWSALPLSEKDLVLLASHLLQAANESEE